jgi:hypothetical protein
MPPQQCHRLLDFVDNGLMFGTHGNSTSNIEFFDREKIV